MPSRGRPKLSTPDLRTPAGKGVRHRRNCDWPAGKFKSEKSGCGNRDNCGIFNEAENTALFLAN